MCASAAFTDEHRTTARRWAKPPCANPDYRKRAASSVKTGSGRLAIRIVGGSHAKVPRSFCDTFGDTFSPISMHFNAARCARIVPIKALQ